MTTEEDYDKAFAKNWRLEIPPTVCPFCKRKLSSRKWDDALDCSIQESNIFESHAFEFRRVIHGVTRQTSAKWTYPLVMPKITITSNSIIYDKDFCLSDNVVLHPAGTTSHWIAITGALDQPTMPGFYSLEEVTDIFKNLIDRLTKLEVMK